MMINNKEFFERIIEYSKTKTLESVGACLSYHHAEAFLQCPRNVFYKNAIPAFCRAVGIDFYGLNNSDEKVLSPFSADALGKALMAGLKTGTAKGALDDYHERVGYDAINALSDNDKIKVAELERELCNRVSLCLYHIHEYFDAVEYETEIRLEYKGKRRNITLAGELDLLVHGKLGTFLVEVKNTGNPGWIIAKSGQLEYYNRLLKENGYKIDGSFYMLFPAWYDKEGKSIFATNDDIQIKEGNKDLTEYWDAFAELMALPLRPDAWEPTKKFPIPKCKTCAQRKTCEIGRQ